ncbi:MAG: type pilus assembly protein PilX [Thauera sp.]|nr:PilX N-terminal domain-containing pilus assembly protein [Thauera sp.]MDI3491373.1 type pilus assembly protein PilX [Thauera sp.]
MNKQFSSPSNQQGTVLLVAMIMLLIMSMLGISSMRGTGLEERMSGNWRDQNLALQAAEAALRQGERSLPNARPAPCATCLVKELSKTDSATYNYLLSTDPAKREEWRTRATPYGVTMAGLASQPRYLIEYRGAIRDTLTGGFGYDGATEGQRDLYMITAEGRGQTLDTSRILQIIYSKRYN